MLIDRKVKIFIVSGFLGLLVSSATADGTSALPSFANYAVNISVGPFAGTLHLTDDQEHYSEHWKNRATSELRKPENFAGHYRIFTSSNNQGNECIDHDGGICGWIIDKLSGRIVASLPSNNGTSVYNQVADNGTPVGEEFRLNAKKNSTLLVLTGQAIPQKLEHDKDGLPITNPCETTYHNFKNNQFIKVFVDKNGCNTD